MYVVVLTYHVSTTRHQQHTKIHSISGLIPFIIPRHLVKKIALILTAISAFAGCSNEEDKPAGDTIRIAAMYSDDGGGTSEELTAVEYAAGLVNSAQFLESDIEVVPLLFNDETDREAKARELIDDAGVVAFVSQFSATAKEILQVTQEPEYSSYVHCSGSATSPILNNPETTRPADGTFAADNNDTLFRAVMSGSYVTKIMWDIATDKSKIAILSSDDSFGTSFRGDLLALAAADSKTFVSDTVVPVSGTAGVYSDLTASVLSDNRSGTVSTVIMVGLAAETGQVLKALVEAQPAFAGEIILSNGAVDPATFVSQTGALATWRSVPGNSIRAVIHYLEGGEHSASFMAGFEEASSIREYNGFVPAHVDCLFSLSLALASGSADGLSGAEAVKAGMLKQKDSALASADVATITPATLADTKAAVAAGKSLRLDGASGVVTYDDNGDRASQLFSVMVPEGSGPFNWAIGYTWDPVENVCVSGC